MIKIDKSFNKIINKKFNIYAFIFGHLYMYYCRMFLYGFLAFVIEIFILLISNYVFSFILIILFHILYGFFTNKIYAYYINKKKRKSNKPLFSVNILRIITIIYILFFTFISILTIVSDIEYKNYIYYDSNVNIDKIFYITITDNFKREDSYYFKYVNKIDDIYSNACEFSFYKVKNYNNIKKLVKQLKKENKYYNKSDLKSIELNSIKWKYFASKSEYRDIYYYITDNNGLYLFIYEISKNDENKYIECMKDYSVIINSIKVKR